jgi:hypothetical protein
MQAHRLKSVFKDDQEDEAFKTMIGVLVTEDETVNEEGFDVMEVMGNIDLSPEQLLFFEDALIGGIDGLTAYYAAECRQGLLASVSGAFRLTENTDFLDPSQLMKMQLAVTNVMEGVNVVTAYCDFTAMIESVSELFSVDDITSEWTQYVVLGSRVGGFMISDFWVNQKCIMEAYEGLVGFDAGRCGSNIISAVLDTLL